MLGFWGQGIQYTYVFNKLEQCEIIYEDNIMQSQLMKCISYGDL